MPSGIAARSMMARRGEVRSWSRHRDLVAARSRERITEGEKKKSERVKTQSRCQDVGNQRETSFLSTTRQSAIAPTYNDLYIL